MFEVTRTIPITIEIEEEPYGGMCSNCQFLNSSNGDLYNLVEPLCLLFNVLLERVTPEIALRCDECCDCFGFEKDVSK
jgi:hypothetical protein